MSLKDYSVHRDKFELDQNTVQALRLSFPCCDCLNRHGKDSDEPCRTCDHNVNSVKKSPDCPPKARTRIVPVPVDDGGFYCFTWRDTQRFLSMALSVQQWTGRLEVTFADGTKKMYHFKAAFGVGSFRGDSDSGIVANGVVYDGQADFIPATISGVEFWSE